MFRFILEISHDFAIKTLETHAFSIPIHDMQTSAILVEDSLEGKYYHRPLECLYKANLPQPDTSKI